MIYNKDNYDTVVNFLENNEIPKSVAKQIVGKTVDDEISLSLFVFANYLKLRYPNYVEKAYSMNLMFKRVFKDNYQKALEYFEVEPKHLETQFLRDKWIQEEIDRGER